MIDQPLVDDHQLVVDLADAGAGLVLEQLHAGGLQRPASPPTAARPGRGRGRRGSARCRPDQPDHGVVDARSDCAKVNIAKSMLLARLEHLLHDLHLRAVARREQRLDPHAARGGTPPAAARAARAGRRTCPPAAASNSARYSSAASLPCRITTWLRLLPLWTAAGRRGFVPVSVSVKFVEPVSTAAVGAAGVPDDELLVEDRRVQVGDDVDAGAQERRVDDAVVLVRPPPGAHGSVSALSSTR